MSFANTYQSGVPKDLPRYPSRQRTALTPTPPAAQQPVPTSLPTFAGSGSMAPRTTMSAAPAPQAKPPTTGLTRTPPNRDAATLRDGGSAVSVRPGATGPNLGGTITRGGVTRTYAPSPGVQVPVTPAQDQEQDAQPVPTTPVQPPLTPPSPATPPAGGNAALPAQPPVMPPAQTEGNNPLTGAATTQPPGTTADLGPVKRYVRPQIPFENLQERPIPYPAYLQPKPESGPASLGDVESLRGAPVRVTPAAAPSALGVSSRGSAVPRGIDAMPPNPLIGGTGLYSRQFRNQKSASMYGDFVKRLFSPMA